MKRFRDISCGHCGNIAPMKILGGAVEKLGGGEYHEGFGSEPEHGNEYFILQCPACKEANVVKMPWHDLIENEEEFNDIPHEILYPKDEEVPKGLPNKLEKEYTDAEKIKPINFKAYAMQLRRVLEIVCKDKGAKGDTLAQMLKNLANNSELPEKLVKVAEGLKNMGNLGAHEENPDFKYEDAELMKALTNAVLEYLYTAPHLANLAQEKLGRVKDDGKA